MSNILRICHSQNIENFLEIKGQKNNRIQYIGPVASFATRISTTIGDKMNFSLVTNQGIGKPIDSEGHFDGCIGL